MRYVSVNSLKPGMQLGKDIINQKNYNKMPLVRSNAVLSTPIINALANNGYKGVYIKDELSQDIEIEEFVKDELKQTTLRAIRTKDVESIVKESQVIVDEVLSKRSVELNLLEMIDQEDYEGQALSVCELALALGKECQLNPVLLRSLAVAALLSNIGLMLNDNDKKKINVDKKLVAKAMVQNIDINEYLHTVFGFYYLGNFQSVSAVAKQAVLFHHEAENGTGYPFGVNGDKLTTPAKILNICSRYEEYLRLYGPIEARNRLSDDYRNNLVDKEMTEKFIRNIPIFPKGSTVALSDGDLAIVVSNSSMPERPYVRKLDGTDIDLTKVLDITVTQLYCDDKVLDVNGEEVFTR